MEGRINPCFFSSCLVLLLLGPQGQEAGTSGQVNHYPYRQNNESGNLLIIVGNIISSTNTTTSTRKTSLSTSSASK